MLAHEAAALTAIRGTFAETVTYSGAGLPAAPVSAVRSDGEAGAFQGPGSTLRTIAYEVAQAALPRRPAKGDLIVHGVLRWRVNEIVPRDDVGAWLLIVEKAAP